MKHTCFFWIPYMYHHWTFSFKVFFYNIIAVEKIIRKKNEKECHCFTFLIKKTEQYINIPVQIKKKPVNPAFYLFFYLENCFASHSKALMD